MNTPSLITSGDVLTAALRECGIDTVFGVPGTQNLHLYECLRRAKLRCILATSETAATFMANGYYRASGKVAVTVSIPGPGFTYALTGLAQARADSAAVIHVMQINPAGDSKRFRFQELDLPHLTAPIAKGFIEITDAADIRKGVYEAWVLSRTGEPGPAVLTVTTNALVQRAEDVQQAEVPLPDEPSETQIDAVVELLSGNTKVAIFAGQGAFGGAAELRELATRFNAPVVTTSAGRGAIPESHPLSIDLDFTLGSVYSINDLFAECDVILALGCKFSHNGTAGFKLDFGPGKLIQVDTAATVLNAGNYQPDMRVQGDVRSFLQQLLTHTADMTIPGFTTAELANRKSSLLALKREQISCEPSIRGYADGRFETLFAAMNELLDEQTILVTDTGLHQTITRVYAQINQPRQLITPSDFQSTGYGIPAGMGAAAARPDCRATILTGDGSFAIHALDLLEAMRQKLKIGVIVFNDKHLGSIRLQQINAFGDETSVAVTNPDYESLAQALHLQYFSLADGPDTLTAFFQSGQVSLLEVHVVDSPELKKIRARRKLRERISRSPVAPALKALRSWLQRD